MSATGDPLSAALEFLPHGPEFRFVDRLSRLAGGESGAGEYRVRGDEPFLRGHFPGDPIFPGVLVVEAVAQLAGVVAQSDPKTPPLPGLKLTAIRNVKIYGAVRPGQLIELEARITGRLAGLIQAQAIARVEAATIMSAELTLAGGEMPSAVAR